PGYLYVKAGRDLGRFASQTEFFALSPSMQLTYRSLPVVGGVNGIVTGIDSIGNLYNAALTTDGASIVASYGVSRGMDQAAFIAAYIDPTTAKPGGLDDGSKSLIGFVAHYDDVAADGYSSDQAWQRFRQLPDEAQAIFV